MKDFSAFTRHEEIQELGSQVPWGSDTQCQGGLLAASRAAAVDPGGCFPTSSSCISLSPELSLPKRGWHSEHRRCHHQGQLGPLPGVPCVISLKVGLREGRWVGIRGPPGTALPWSSVLCVHRTSQPLSLALSAHFRGSEELLSWTCKADGGAWNLIPGARNPTLTCLRLCSFFQGQLHAHVGSFLLSPLSPPWTPEGPTSCPPLQHVCLSCDEVLHSPVLGGHTGCRFLLCQSF